MNGKSWRDFMAAWQRFLVALEVHEAELPEIGPYKTDFELALAEFKAGKARQADLEKRRKRATQEVNEQRAECHELATRLKSLIVAHFGPKDERLAAFGIKLPGGYSRQPREVGEESGSPGCH